MALTQHTADGAEATGKEYELRDNTGKGHVVGLSLRVRKSGKRAYYVQVGRGRRVRIGDASQLTLTQARKLAKQELGKAAAGHDHQAEMRRKRAMATETLGAYLDGAYKAHAEQNLATGPELIARIKNAFPHCLDKPMQNITELDMAKWRKARANVKAETQRRELSYLKAALNHAVKNKLIPGHQLTHYRVRATNAEQDTGKLVRFLSEDEEARLRAALAARDAKLRQERDSGNAWRRERHKAEMPALGLYGDHVTPMVLLALNTGLRRGDLFSLRWDALDLDRQQMTLIIRKTSHARRKAGKRVEPVTLPLSGEAVRVLREWRKLTTGDLVFPSPYGGRLDNITKAWTAVLDAAGIEGLRFHDLRHTFASRLVQAGVDLNTVRELMTHSDIKMTLVYAHLSPDHKAAALAKAFSPGLEVVQ